VNSNASNVNLGPANCPATGIRGDLAADNAISLERLPGAMQVRFPRAVASSQVEVLGLDGRPAAGILIQPGKESALILGWKAPGLYVLRLLSPNGETDLVRKIFLP
jgi:hypothetical protein